MVTVNVTESRVSLSVDNRAIKGFVQAQREQQWSKNGAPRDTWQNRGPIWFYSIYSYTLLPETEKRIYPFQSHSTNIVAIQLAFK